MYASIKSYCDQLTNEFSQIPSARKTLLEKITSYIIEKRAQNEPVKLVYICTHNSRRSHFGQVWAQVAATYYHVDNVYTYSGGTEATAFNINAINALKRIGFEIKAGNEENNPTAVLNFDENQNPLECFSKVYDDAANPKHGFAAIMTCSEAEQNCPFIPGAELRVSTPYDDPKMADHTALQDKIYDERCRQIAIEALYVFSKVRNGHSND